MIKTGDWFWEENWVICKQETISIKQTCMHIHKITEIIKDE